MNEENRTYGARKTAYVPASGLRGTYGEKSRGEVPVNEENRTYGVRKAVYVPVSSPRGTSRARKTAYVQTGSQGGTSRARKAVYVPASRQRRDIERKISYATAPIEVQIAKNNNI